MPGFKIDEVTSPSRYCFSFFHVLGGRFAFDFSRFVAALCLSLSFCYVLFSNHVVSFVSASPGILLYQSVEASQATSRTDNWIQDTMKTSRNSGPGCSIWTTRSVRTSSELNGCFGTFTPDPNLKGKKRKLSFCCS